MVLIIEHVKLNEFWYNANYTITKLTLVYIHTQVTTRFEQLYLKVKTITQKQQDNRRSKPERHYITTLFFLTDFK